MASAQVEKHYYPSKTGAKFHASNAFVRGLMGPVGAGKSVDCCMEILRRARAQIPNAEGKRRSRWAIIRNTYGELKTTTIKTWQDWVPDSVCHLKSGAPIEGKLVQPLEDGTVMELEVWFLALDRPEHVKKLLSLELTGAWINEAREVPKAILDGLTGRVNRFPSKADGGFNWSGVIMDTNPPDDDHWWYKLAEEDTPINWAFFQQPPALNYDEHLGWQPNPEAENVENHTMGFKYWLLMVAGKTMEWCRVYVMGLYGSVMDGKPVYPEYNDDLHLQEHVEPYQKTLILGWDFGLTPACIIGQVSASGQLRILDEVVCEGTMGARQFARNAVIPFLAENYPGLQHISYADPAGGQRAQANEITCFDEVIAAGFPMGDDVTNKFKSRREAVVFYLNNMVDGQPGFVLSKKCKVLRKGFNGGYRFKRVQVAGDERFQDEADKNSYSHPHDGLQYLCLGARSGYQPQQKTTARKVVKKSRRAWH